MKTIPLSSTIVLLCWVALLYTDVFTVKGIPNTTIDDYYCSDDTYVEGSPYAAEVEYGLNELAYMTIDMVGMRKSLTGSYAAGFAYCQATLFNDPDDCIICLEAAADFLRDDCELSNTAYVAMIDCGMSYGPIPDPE